MQRKNTCTCSYTQDDRTCNVHRKSAYRNPWKREDEDAFIKVNEVDEEEQ